MTEHFADCLVLNTVRAARALTRRYDRALKPYGVTVIQFTVLIVVSTSQGVSVNRMAERIGMDRTTLLRNLQLLERRGLVRASRPEKGNIRHYALTGEGAALLDILIPLWREAQAQIRARLDPFDPDAVLGALRTMSEN